MSDDKLREALKEIAEIPATLFVPGAEGTTHYIEASRVMAVVQKFYPTIEPELLSKRDHNGATLLEVLRVADVCESKDLLKAVNDIYYLARKLPITEVVYGIVISVLHRLRQPDAQDKAKNISEKILYCDSWSTTNGSIYALLRRELANEDVTRECYARLGAWFVEGPQ